MSVANTYNMVELLKSGLRADLVQIIHKELVDELVADFRDKADKLVAEYTSKVTMKGVETLRDVYGLRDELRVYINGVDAGTVESRRDK